MAKTIDMTKVNLSGKSLIYLTAAFTFVLLAYGVSTIAAGKVRDFASGATAGITQQTEELF